MCSKSPSLIKMGLSAGRQKRRLKPSYNLNVALESRRAVGVSLSLGRKAYTGKPENMIGPENKFIQKLILL